MRMKDKVAIVTGASGGLGSEIAKAFGREGAHVMAFAGRRLEAAEEVAKEIAAAGGSALAKSVDVSSPASVEGAVSEIYEKFGRIDILINNAGARRDNFLIRMTDEEWEEVVNVNLSGVFYFMRSVGKRMFRQRSGRIVNISSVAGVLGNPGQCNYSASKAGVIGLTKAAARELAMRQVTVNAIAPGFIDAGMTSKLSDEIREKLIQGVPLGRAGCANDVAEACLFLASDAACYITGQVLCVDGGFAM
ncbi:MAG TPA: 3-oxoacyl-[acyl-carrier-protein] reductase [Firmicutes bacterium]|jgi:3-oxoacyl-[acyl-carrier protein] reductase|nr:3-oxoacyl-[acyl-carrier-protein] reductase [Bacillota bacterium]